MESIDEMISADHIQWIKNSKIYKSMDQHDIILFPKEFVIPDILTNEPVKIVIRSVFYFEDHPSNFYHYIRNCNIDDLIFLYQEEQMDYRKVDLNVLINFRKMNEIEFSVIIIKHDLDYFVNLIKIVITACSDSNSFRRLINAAL